MSSLSPWERGYGRRKPGPWAKIDWSHEVCRSLVGCWLLHDGPTYRNLTHFGPNATQNAGTVSGTPGKFGGLGANFPNGPNLSCGNGTTFKQAFTSANDLTVLLWIQFTSTTGSQGVFTRTTPGTAWDYDIYFSSGTVHYYQDNGGSDVACTTTLTADSKYHQVVVSKPAGTASFYIDGVFTNSASVTSTLSLSTSEVITIGTDGTGAFNGKLDHAVLWNRALSAAEISALYQQPFAFLQQSSLAQYMSLSPALTAALDEEGLTLAPCWTW